MPSYIVIVKYNCVFDCSNAFSATSVRHSSTRNANHQLDVPNARDSKNDDIYLMITVSCKQEQILNINTVKQSVYLFKYNSICAIIE